MFFSSRIFQQFIFIVASSPLKFSILSFILWAEQHVCLVPPIPGVHVYLFLLSREFFWVHFWFFFFCWFSLMASCFGPAYFCLCVRNCICIIILEIIWGLGWCLLLQRILGLLLPGTWEALASQGHLNPVLVTDVFEAKLQFLVRPVEFWLTQS